MSFFFCNFATNLLCRNVKTAQFSYEIHFYTHQKEMKKILFVNQDMVPYVDETEVSKAGRTVAQKVQETGQEIRTFMPRWGTINERRGQLHEVIRLSGLNISINDIDHPLIIKVASIPGTKMQVYFIDNDEFFTRKGQVLDEDGKPYADNGERAAFFARGVIETIKKLRWVPDVIHCQGWMAAMIRVYAKVAYKEDPVMANVKVVTSVIEQPVQAELNADTKDCIAYGDVTKDSLAKYADTMSSDELMKLAVDYSDGVIKGSENASDEIMDYAKAEGKAVLDYQGDDFAKAYVGFYDSL